MKNELSNAEIELILTSLTYSKRAIEDAESTPLDVRNSKLAELELVTSKLRKMKKII